MPKTIKRILGLVTSFVVLITGLSLSSPANAALPATVNVKVHYNRTAGDYDGWNVFFWKNVDGTGDVGLDPGSNFTGTDAWGVYATRTITEMSTFKDLGFIVRKSTGTNAWAAKDGSKCGPTSNGDRFLTPDAQGNVEVWVIQDDCTVYNSQPRLSAVDPKLTLAAIDDLRKITVRTNVKGDFSGPDFGGFSLSGGLEIDRIEAISNTLSATAGIAIYTKADIPFGQNFTLTHTGATPETTFGSLAVSVGAVMNSTGFNEAFTYEGNDLGYTYTPAATAFRVWAPIAANVNLFLYGKSAVGPNNAPAEVIAMTKSDKGTWTASVTGDLDGVYYMFQVNRNGRNVIVVDPYARSSAANGYRSVVVNLDKTDPTNWTSSKPDFSGKNVDAMIYELHVRDFSNSSTSGIPANHRNKFLAFTDNNTSYSWTSTVTDSKTKKKKTVKHTTKTGVAAIKSLGVTHVQLLPIYDFASGGDELNPTFNWGYDPAQYNVPEGGYSTNANDPLTRISELKSAVQNLHDNGLRVIMDVVYNHVSSADEFSMEQITPGYFFRRTPSGDYYDGTGCGNETASERPMVRKFIVDSVKYWASEYNLDGFRFDLMGIHDVTTMKAVRTALNEIDPSIIVLGEGWNMGNLDPRFGSKASQDNINLMDGIAAFNDQIRDGIKGSVFNAGETGWATGDFNKNADVIAGITGNVNLDGRTSPRWTTNDPGQSVNYVEAHDNLTLADKLKASVGGSTTKRSRLQRFAGSIVYLSQGMPFMQAGQEFERSKGGNDNSYNAGDSVNRLNYTLRDSNATSLKYYSGLISLRKAHPAFRMQTTAQVKSNLSFIFKSGGIIAYRLNGTAVGDSWASIVVAHNSNSVARTVKLPAGAYTWYVVVKDDKAGTSTIQTLKKPSSITVPANSTYVMYRK